MSRVTLKDVAELAGVNFTLVSKYLNGSPQARMTEETRGRIDRALAQLNYRPNGVARALRAGRTHAVGLLSGDLTNEYSAHFADYCMRVLREHGYELLLTLNDAGDGGDAAVQALLGRDVDGILSHSMGERLVRRLSCPVVLNGQMSLEYSTVNLDIGGSLLEALRAVPGRVTGLFFENSVWREEARIACLKLGRSMDIKMLSLNQETREGQLREICQTRPEVILTNGWQTLRMLQEMLSGKRGYRPKILAHANCQGPFWQSPLVAGVIYSPTRDLIRRSCELLLDKIEHGEGRPKHLAIPTRFLAAGTDDYNALCSKNFQLT